MNEYLMNVYIYIGVGGWLVSLHCLDHDECFGPASIF